MEVGDFDDTPAPSARPSQAALRSHDLQSSDHTTQTESSKGHLFTFLKTSTSGPMLFSRDGPSSPAPSQGPSASTPEQSQPSQKTGDENQTTSSVQSPTLSSPVSPERMASNRGTSPPIPTSDRICLDPMLHRKETHARAHHPGLLRGADFCDWGEAAKDSENIELLSQPNSPSSGGFSMRSGEVHRLQPDGSVVVEQVSVPVERTPGHSRALKIRPAFNLNAARNIVNPEDEKKPTHEPFRNKVRPFDPELEGKTADSAKPTVRRLSGSMEDPVEEISTPMDIPISKIRPAFDPGLQSPREED